MVLIQSIEPEAADAPRAVRRCNLAAYPAVAGRADSAPCTVLTLGIGRDFSAEAELAGRHGCHGWAVDPLVRRQPEPATGRLAFLRMPFVRVPAGFHDGRSLVRAAGPSVNATMSPTAPPVSTP